jgi:hypothetical protein
MTKPKIKPVFAWVIVFDGKISSVFMDGAPILHKRPAFDLVPGAKWFRVEIRPAPLRRKPTKRANP